MTAEPEQKPVSPAPAPAPQKKGAGLMAGAKAWLPTKGQAAVAAIALLSLSNIATWVKLVREDPPMIVTVGVREMSQGYIAKLALSEISPQEAAVKTELFLTATQDTVKRAASNKNVLLLARECVLAGEAADITKEVGDAVQRAMAEASGTSVAGAPPPVQTSAATVPTVP